MASVKTVYHGTATIPAGGASVTVSLATGVVKNNSFLQFGCSVSNADPAGYIVAGELTNGTTLTFSRGGMVGSPAITIKWHVVEFDSGVSVQHISQNANAAQTDVAITAVDLARTFVLATYRTSGLIFSANDCLSAELTSTTNLRLSSNLTSTDRHVHAQVITFTGADVQSGSVSFLSGDLSKEVTLGTPLGAQSLLVFSYTADDGTEANIGQKMIRGVITDSDTLTFDRTNSGVAATVKWFAISFTDGTVVQRGTAAFDADDLQLDVAVSASLIARSVPLAAGYQQRAGKTGYSSADDMAAATFTFEETADTNLRLVRAAHLGAAADVYWQLVTFASTSEDVVTPGSIGGVGGIGTPTLIASEQDWVFTVGGVVQTVKVKKNSTVSGEMELGTLGSANAELYDEKFATAGVYRPALRETMTYRYKNADVFTGPIVRIDEDALQQPKIGTVSKIDVNDNHLWAESQRVTIAYEGEVSLRDIATELVAYLAPFGVTLDPLMGTGPNLVNLIFDDIKITDALNYLSGMTGWPWVIGPDNVLRMFPVGSLVASIDHNGIFEITAVREHVEYRNHIKVKFGPEMVVTKREIFTGHPSQTTYNLKYRNTILNGVGYIHLNGVFTPIGAGTNWLLTANALFATVGPAEGVEIIVDYPAQMPETAQAEDAAAIAANGRWTTSYRAPEILDIESATALAEALLRKHVNPNVVVTLTTHQGPYYPGYILPMNIPEREVVGDYMIRNVEFNDESDGILRWKLTLVAGGDYLPGWVDYFKRALGQGSPSGSGSGGTISGSLVPAQSGIHVQEVVAFSGQRVTGAHQSRLSTWIHGGVDGAALILGMNVAEAWAIVADWARGMLGISRIVFVPLKNSSTGPKMGMQLTQDAAAPVTGHYYLTHDGHPDGRLYIGSRTNAALGSGGAGPLYRVHGVYTQEFDGGGIFIRSGNVTPAALSGDVYDWNPVDNVNPALSFKQYSTLLVQADAGRTIRGLDATNVLDGTIIQMTNIGNYMIGLAHQDTGNFTTASRMACPRQVTFALDPNATVSLRRQQSRWFVLAQ